MQYKKNCILQSKEGEWRLYSPDVLLYSKEQGKGILVIKTMLIRDKKMYDQWKDHVPNQYYVQVLHGLLATKFDYVIIVAELRFARQRNSEIVVHKINRSEVIEDLEWLDEKEKYNWNEYYIKNVRPPVIIEF